MMASICETCRHYNELYSSDKERIEGVCEIELPPWMLRNGLDDVSRVVRNTDTCEFWNLDRGNNG